MIAPSTAARRGNPKKPKEMHPKFTLDVKKGTFFTLEGKPPKNILYTRGGKRHKHSSH